MTLDEHVFAIDSKIRAISTWKAALFYASCSERFLPLYAAFAIVEGWGSVEVVRGALDSVWRAAAHSKNDPAGYEHTIQRILGETPHADDFDAVEATFAQDVSVLISAALRSTMGERNTDFPIDAAFETLRAAACVESTGFLDLGDGPKAAEFEGAFLNSGVFAQEVSLQEQDLEALSNTTRPTVNLVGLLRERARHNAYSTDVLLPTQGDAANS